MNENKVIKEIVCLKSIELSTGKPRILRPSDFEDGTQWERIVEAALTDASSYEIRRETIYTEEEQQIDLSRIELKDMTTMSRERVAEIGTFYGIKDEGQSRATYIDQIAGEKEKESAVLKRSGVVPNAPSEPLAPSTPASTTPASGTGPEDVSGKDKQ